MISLSNAISYPWTVAAKIKYNNKARAKNFELDVFLLMLLLN
jgi:hypothetical protein